MGNVSARSRGSEHGDAVNSCSHHICESGETGNPKPPKEGQQAKEKPLGKFGRTTHPSGVSAPGSTPGPASAVSRVGMARQG